MSGPPKDRGLCYYQGARESARTAGLKMSICVICAHKMTHLLCPGNWGLDAGTYVTVSGENLSSWKSWQQEGKQQQQMDFHLLLS